MCTVTFVPLNKADFILTSNRDEAPDRTSGMPDFYEINQTKVLYPKDDVSGGTWIGASERNRVLCILNGGFEWHERQSNYRHSRGIIVKELLVSEDLNYSVSSCNLDGIEPFTLVIVDWTTDLCCFELVWDGEKKHFRKLPLEPKIWSSSSLYTSQMKSERQKWFDRLKTDSELNKTSLLNFHKTAGAGNSNYGVIMDRVFVKTTSITQIIKESNIVEMIYFDLLNADKSSNSLTTLQLLNE